MKERKITKRDDPSLWSSKCQQLIEVSSTESCCLAFFYLLILQSTLSYDVVVEVEKNHSKEVGVLIFHSYTGELMKKSDSKSSLFLFSAIHQKTLKPLINPTPWTSIVCGWIKNNNAIGRNRVSMIKTCIYIFICIFNALIL